MQRLDLQSRSTYAFGWTQPATAPRAVAQGDLSHISVVSHLEMIIESADSHRYLRSACNDLVRVERVALVCKDGDNREHDAVVESTSTCSRKCHLVLILATSPG